MPTEPETATVELPREELHHAVHVFGVPEKPQIDCPLCRSIRGKLADVVVSGVRGGDHHE